MRCTLTSGTKKDIAEPGSLLIELGKNSSTALLVAEEQKPDKNCGKT